MDLLPHLPILHGRFVYELLADARLPRWKGALLRGGWGRALSAVFCHPHCDQPAHCSHACPYRTLFTPEAPPGHVAGVRDAPRPFLVRPPLTDHTSMRRGDQLVFEVVLIGSAVHYAHIMMAAFAHLGRLGLGGDRSPATLIKGFTFSDQAQRFIPCFHNGQWLPLASPIQPQFFYATVPDAGNRYHLQFVTPTRIKHAGTMRRQFDIPLLVSAAIRRLQHLNTLYGTMPWQPPVDALLADARAAHIVGDRMRWVDWGRTSEATGQTMHLGGMIGTLDVHGMTPALATLLTMASTVHLGKAAVFGNGWFRVQPTDRTVWEAAAQQPRGAH